MHISQITLEDTKARLALHTEEELDEAKRALERAEAALDHAKRFLEVATGKVEILDGLRTVYGKPHSLLNLLAAWQLCDEGRSEIVGCIIVTKTVAAAMKWFTGRDPTVVMILDGPEAGLFRVNLKEVV